MHDRRIRLLFVLSYPQHMAGSQRSLLELVRHLPARFEALVLLPDEGEVAEAFRSAGVEVHVLRPGPFLNSYGKAMLAWSWHRKLWITLHEYIPFALRVSRFLHSHRIDLVHANDPRATLLVGPVARLLGRPLVAHLRGEKPFEGFMWQVYERLPHRFITVSNGIRSSLSDRARARSVTIYNGTGKLSGKGRRVPWLAALRREGVTVVCCFASVVPFKGQHHLLDAVARLNGRDIGQRAIFVCIGKLDKEYEIYQEWLCQRRKALGVGNLFFTGWQADPFSFYRMADITVLPSVSREVLDIDERTLEVHGNEGFPRTHLEAMSFGIPIVGTDIAGVREQVEDGVNGYVVPPSDPEALADALERLLVDPVQRRRMGMAGKSRVLAKFSTDAYVHGVVEVYRQLARTCDA